MSETLFVLLLMAAVFFGVVALATLLQPRSSKQLESRAAELRHRLVRAQSPAEGTKSLRRKQETSRFAVLNYVVSHLPSADRLRHRLERTGKPITVQQYLGVCGGILFVVGLLLYAMAGLSPLLAFLIALTAGLGIPHYITGFLARRRLQAFMKLFPDVIELIVRGLRSGLPLQEGIKVVAQEVRDPVRSEFRYIAELIHLGVTVEAALKEVAERLDITEFNFFVTSIILQRETGGNLAEILSNIADTIRKRHMMKMKIHALASEARASAYIVGSLPLLVTLALSFIAPKYIQVLVDDFRGNIALAAAIGGVTLGMLVMRRMGNFEI